MSEPTRPPNPDARRRALRTARAVLEAFALGRPYDPGISRLLDMLATTEEDAMNDALDSALTPEAFDWTSCAVCGRPTVVPLTWKFGPAGYGEPDPPERAVVHAACERDLARIDHGADDDAAES